MGVLAKNCAKNCRDILIVEDDEGIREALRMYLEFEGYTVLEASNGKEGLEVLQKHAPFCIILLDLMVPVMDGWKFAESIESDSVFSKIPIVVCTAFSNPRKIINARAQLSKPVNMENLLEVIQQYCG